ncbi:hypothetical protein Rsub_11636 [Raphidocelis subcapitata]|uniref:ERD4-related membrane protein n=1 Tax=Raphidocelis subcapitata TaxID=307507 RepID=A0A2V0PH91_9CHLO|nr:hypothetical protein Rsub_11636 [Raphidocelis subcapitata]|eukprot:GBF99191.1 hypothetical protein Rsub_11636 [Raphidocelis subcapitata]
MSLLAKMAKASPSPALPVPSPSPQLMTKELSTGKAYQNEVSSIKVALALNAAIGAGCLLGFLVMRSFMLQYQLRTVLPYITIRPPPLPSGVRRAISWIKPVFCASDVWMLHSAGLDALVMQKSLALCIQLLLPIALLGCCVLMPLQLSEAYERGNTSTFTRLTMANIDPRSKIMWGHWTCVFVFLGWTLLLLEYHYRQYVSLRQFYLRSGNSGWNAWRELHMAEADGVGVHQRSRFADLVDNARMDGILKVMDAENAAAPMNWWRRKMAWLTSWTGKGSPEDVMALAQELTANDANDRVIKRLRSGRAGPSTGFGGAGESSGPSSAAAGSKPAPPAPRAQGKPQPLGEGLEGPFETAAGAGASAGVAASDSFESFEEVEHLVAPRWWTSVDVVTNEEGRLRRLTAEEEKETKGSHMLLARPSVRYRKTINTFDFGGRPVGVHAQQYAVLVTDVDQAVYPELMRSGFPLGAGVCGVANVKYDEADTQWLGQRYARLARDAKRGALPCASKVEASKSSGIELADKKAAAAVSAAEALSLLEAAEAGVAPTSSGPSCSPPRAAVKPGRAAGLWAFARTAMRDGRLRKLAHSEQYSLVGAVFSTLFPDDFDRVVPVFNYRECDLLMRRWDKAMAQLEAAEHAIKLGGKPRLVKPKGSKEKVEQVVWLRQRVEELANQVLEARERALVFNSTPSFFVLFRSQKAAAIAASCNIHPLRRQLFNVRPAPGPEEVNWQALWYTHGQRTIRGMLVAPFIVIVVLLPVSLATAAMTQLNEAFCSPTNTVLRWDAYCRGGGKQIYAILKALLTGFVPVLLVQLWQGLLMPRLVFMAAQSEACHYSLSDLDRRMGSIYFLWTAFNFFAGGVIGSTALSQVPELVSKPFETPARLGYSLPASAKFFLSYLILRLFMSIPMRFLIIQPGVLHAWIRFPLSFFMKGMKDENATERARFMRTAIRSPRYGIEFGGNICLVALVSLAFAVICPLVPLVGFGFFCASWVFWRYNFIYCTQRKYESGGTFFVFLGNRLMVCAAVMVVFSGCVMMVKSAFVQATLLWVVGLVAIYSFYRRTQDLYVGALSEMPLLVAQMAPRARVPATVYVAPPLQHGGWLWYPEHNKVWENVGMPGLSF